MIDMGLYRQLHLSSYSGRVFAIQRKIGVGGGSGDKLKMTGVLQIAESSKYVALIGFEIIPDIGIDQIEIHLR
jgi:hypothetical protein